MVTGSPDHTLTRRWVAALGGAGRLVLGSNPWPGTGLVGHGAGILLALLAVLYLSGNALAAVVGTAPLYHYYQNDFIAYLTGGTVLLQGGIAELYEAERQLEVQTALLGQVGARPPSLIAYMNPPLWAASVGLLSPLGVLGSAWAWRVGTLVAAATTLFAIVHQETRASRATWRGTLLLLTFFPFLQFWHYGNMGALLLVALGGWLVLARAHRPWAAGLVLSLFVLKPQYLVFPLVYLAWKGQWRQIGGVMMGAALQMMATLGLYLAAGSVPTLDTVRQFLTFTASESTSSVVGQVSLRAALTLFLPTLEPALTYAGVVVLSAVATVGVLVVLGRRWEPTTERFDWELLVLAAMMNLTALHNQLSGLTLFLVPAAVILVSRPTLGSFHIPRTVLAVLLAAPSIGIMLVNAYLWAYMVSGWLTTLGALAIGISVIRQMGWRSGPATTLVAATVAPEHR